MADILLGTPTRLPEPVNSSSRDESAVLSSDGLTLYFAANRGGGQRLWQVTREGVDSPWQFPERIDSINRLVTASSISSDGLELYFADGWAPNFGGSSDIWLSRRTSIEDTWGAPENLGLTINSTSFDDAPYVSADGLSLYFSSNRPGGHGGNDLYVARRITVNDAWETPTNLGPAINSPTNDWMGSVSADGLSLYFDSDRQGLGNFVATRTSAEGEFANPVFFPPQVNVSNEAWRMTAAPDGSALYYSVGHSGSVDIWQVPVMPFERVGIDGNGGAYSQDFDESLSVSGSVHESLPTGWTVSQRGGTFFENSTNNPFPTERVLGTGPSIFNAGPNEDSDRALAVYAPLRSGEPLMQLLTEVNGSSASAWQLTFDIEAWDNLRPFAVPGEAAFDVTVDIDRGNGFEELTNLGTITTGPVLALPEGDILDGNLAANRLTFDSGFVPAEIPVGSQLRFRWTVLADAQTAGWVYGLDNVQINLSASPPLLAGDYNGSAMVDQADLDLVLLHWGKDGSVPPTGWTSDLPRGLIDQEELDRVLLGWGQVGGLTAADGAGNVPEPTTTTIFAVVSAALVLTLQVTRRKKL